MQYRRTLLSFCFFISLFACLFLFDLSNSRADEWSEDLTVLCIAVEGDYILIQTTANNGTCGNQGRFIAENNDKRNNIYALAMAAFLSGKKVSIYFDSDKCINLGNVILVMNIH